MKRRIAIGIEYNGTSFNGWQSQPIGHTVQDYLSKAISNVAGHPVLVTAAGRTDAGVHAIDQVAHFDVDVERTNTAWVRGVNRYLPDSIRVWWAKEVNNDFHSRFCAISRTYRYVLYQSATRPALLYGTVGWTHHQLDENAIREGMRCIEGVHDFSTFRSSECQAKSPIKKLYSVQLRRKGPYWLFDFCASGFLHHMVRNLMGALITMGRKQYSFEWMNTLLSCCDRTKAPPTFAADGLYLTGVNYPTPWNFPKPMLYPFD